jgi:hypothetical protein
VFRGVSRSHILVSRAQVIISAPHFLAPGFNHASTNVNKDPRIGIAFLVLSIICQAAQLVYEEKTMGEHETHPLAVVYLEGVFGVLFMCVCVIPLAELWGLESTTESIHMLLASRDIQVIALTFMGVVFVYNIFAIYITALLCCQWHAFMDNFR